MVNYAPEILTLTSSTRSALVGDTVTVTATAFDVEGDKVICPSPTAAALIWYAQIRDSH